MIAQPPACRCLARVWRLVSIPVSLFTAAEAGRPSSQSRRLFHA